MREFWLLTLIVIGLESVGGAQANFAPDALGEHAAVATLRDAREVETLPAVSRASTENVDDVPHVKPTAWYVRAVVWPRNVPLRYTL